MGKPGDIMPGFFLWQAYSEYASDIQSDFSAKNYSSLAYHFDKQPGERFSFLPLKFRDFAGRKNTQDFAPVHNYNRVAPALDKGNDVRRQYNCFSFAEQLCEIVFQPEKGKGVKAV